MDYTLISQNKRVIVEVQSESVLDETQMRGVQEGIHSNRFNRFVDFGFSHIDNKSRIEYFSERFISLDRMLQAAKKRTNGVDKGELRSLFSQIIDVLLLPLEYFYISENNIMLDYDYVYYDTEEKCIKLLYAPFKEEQYDNKERIGKLFGRIGSYIDEQDESTLLYFSKLNIYMTNVENVDYRILKEKVMASVESTKDRLGASAKAGIDESPANSGSVTDHRKSKDGNKQNRDVKEKALQVKEVPVQASNNESTTIRVEKMAKKTLINIVLVQVIIIALVGLIVSSGMFSGDLVKLIGATVLIFGLGEYVAYKFIYLKSEKEVVMRTSSTANTSPKSRQENSKKAESKQSVPKKNKQGKNREEINAVPVKQHIPERETGTIIKMDDEPLPVFEAKEEPEIEAVSEKIEEPIKSEPMAEPVSESVSEVEEPVKANEQTMILPSEDDEKTVIEDSGTVILEEVKRAWYIYRTESGEKTVQINKGQFKVGRKASIVDYCMKEKVISAHHGTFYIVGDKFYYEDAGSSNKSYLDNNELVPFKKTEVTDGMLIKLANIEGEIKITK